MKLQSLKKLPTSPGVYLFKKGKTVIYVGRATNLRSRVKSYFTKDIGDKRSQLIAQMVSEAKSVSHIKTDSVLEAIIYEANLIKKLKPRYNTLEKDDKSFNCVAITKEDFPRILVVRQKDLSSTLTTTNHYPLTTFFGPFPDGSSLREVMKIVRKIFPFRDKCEPNQGKPCFNAQIGLCPGVCYGKISISKYRKNINNIKLFFEGKKKILIKNLEREMKEAINDERFEDASKIKKQIFSINHINEVALLKSSSQGVKNTLRIEGYDIAHMSGNNTGGVMVVIEDGKEIKSEYRLFNIKESKNDDVNNLIEIIERRIKHLEWPMPRLIVVDGGIAQLNAVKRTLHENKWEIPVVAIVKDDAHKAKKIMGDTQIVKGIEKDILLANLESHRFALKNFRKRQQKNFLK